MTSDILALMEYYEKEKGIDRAVMVEAIETALLAASRRSVGPARELQVRIDPAKGKIRAIARLIVVESGKPNYEQIPLAMARRIKADAEVGDEVEVEVTPKDFGRIAAQTAKQAINQRLRQAEKEMIYEEFKDRAGDIVQGTVRRFDKEGVVIDLGRFEGLMPAREKVPGEDYHIGDRFRVYVVAVENGPRGPEIILSRSHPNFVRRLFEFEVSEIADRSVEIRSIAREAGYRTKIAAWSPDSKIDPVGACVGLRGARVKNIVRELNNEKVDVIRWVDDPVEMVIESLKPATIDPSKVTVEEAERRLIVRVREEDLSKAIGTRGRNARLTARLMGWDVRVVKDETEHEKFEAKLSEAEGTLASQLGISEEQANTLVEVGMNSVVAVTTALASDIAEALDISEEEGATILEKAKSLAFDQEASKAAEASAEKQAPSADSESDSAS